MEKAVVPVLRHMEALQEEVHQQDHQLRAAQVGLQREVPDRPDGRPGQRLDDDDDRYEDEYLFNYCDFFQFCIFQLI